MIVVRIRPDLSFEVIDREKEMVRLGSGGLEGKALTADAMEMGLQAFSRFRRLAESHQVEEILAAELRALGAENVAPGRRLVNFQGDKALLYKANLWCRTAIRILKPIAAFEAASEQDLYRGVQATDWAAQEIEGFIC